MSVRRAITILCVFPAVVLAHAGQALQPDDLLSAWEFDPGIVIPLIVAGVLYTAGSRKHVGLTRTPAPLLLGRFGEPCGRTRFALAPAWRSAFFGAHGAARDPDDHRRTAFGGITPACDLFVGLAIELAQGFRRVVENKSCSIVLDFFDCASDGLVDSRTCHLAVARTGAVPSDAAKRLDSLGAAHQLLCLCALVLVGFVVCAWTARLRRRGVVCFHNSRAYRHPGRSAYLCAASVVPGLPHDDAGLGALAARRPADRRADHVGSREPRLPGCGTRAVRGLDEGKRCNVREGVACEVEFF